MALLHFEGFELGFPADWGTALGTVTTSSSTALGYGLCLSNNNSTLTKTFPASSQVFIGFRYTASSSNSPTQVLRLYGDAGATEHLRLWWSSTTTLSLGRSATVIATASVPEPLAGSWSYIEVWATIADSGGRCVVKIDGATVIDFTGDTKNAGTASTLDSMQFGGAGSGVLRYYDDVYICDATGTAPHNTFLGPCRVYALSPTGAGTDTQMTPSAGANWQCVDEQPASAADYVTGSTGQRDTYATADLPSSAGTIFAVQASVVAAKTDAGALTLKTAMRSGGTVYTGTAGALSVSDTIIRTIRTTDPATSATWTKSGIDALEAGAEVA